MSDIKPWVRGPLELLKHAESHFSKDTEIDNRMALISFDNSIEISITAFINLSPSIRGPCPVLKHRSAKNREVQGMLKNYFEKLKYFYKRINALEDTVKVGNDEILWYHQLRNELYHSGNGMVPERQTLVDIREAAIWVFSSLFQTDANQLLYSDVPAPSTSPQPEKPDFFNIVNSFLSFEQALRALEGTKVKMNLFVNNIADMQIYFSDEEIKIIKKSKRLRNEIIHGKNPSSDLTHDSIKELINKLEMLTARLESQRNE